MVVSQLQCENSLKFELSHLPCMMLTPLRQRVTQIKQIEISECKKIDSIQPFICSIHISSKLTCFHTIIFLLLVLVHFVCLLCKYKKNSICKECLSALFELILKVHTYVQAKQKKKKLSIFLGQDFRRQEEKGAIAAQAYFHSIQSIQKHIFPIILLPTLDVQLSTLTTIDEPKSFQSLYFFFNTHDEICAQF